MEIGRIPNKLKMSRRCLGYSQKRVARMLGLADTSTLSRWEQGVSLPSMVQVFRLSRIYHILPHELFEALWRQADTKGDLLVHDDEPFTSNQSFYL